jgi:hypothetical protein
MFVALTNGNVVVFDDWSATFGDGVTPRTITPSDGALTKISVNLHGIAYDADKDLLVLTDVGSPANATDGQLFVIDSAGEANGNVPVSLRIAGPASKLGNPVDLAWDGFSVWIAEKSNNVLLRYDGLLGLESGDLAADDDAASTAPESVALIPAWIGKSK